MDHLPRPAGNAPPKATQEAVGLLSHKGALLVYVQLGVHQDSQVLCKDTFQLVSLRLYWCIPPILVKPLLDPLLSFNIPLNSVVPN